MDRDLSRQLARDPKLRFDWVRILERRAPLIILVALRACFRRRMGAVCLMVPQLAPIFRTHLNKSHPPRGSHPLGEIVDIPCPPQSGLGLPSPFRPCVLDLIAYPKAPHDPEREMHALRAYRQVIDEGALPLVNPRLHTTFPTSPPIWGRISGPRAPESRASWISSLRMRPSRDLFERNCPRGQRRLGRGATYATPR